MDNDSRGTKVRVSVTEPETLTEACAVAADVMAADHHPSDGVRHAAEMIALLLHTGVRIRLGAAVAEVGWQDDGSTGRSGWAVAA